MSKFKVNDGDIATNPPANVQAYVSLAYAVHYAYCLKNAQILRAYKWYKNTVKPKNYFETTYSRYKISLLRLLAYSISCLTDLPIYPPTFTTNMASDISIFL